MRFENQLLIWTGNFSKVYIAYDRKLSRNVILKEFPKENREMAQREYAFLLKIRYKVPEAYDLIDEEDKVILVREYVPGKTLKELLEEFGELPPNVALFICYEVLRFLDYINTRDEFNGDITPSNILLGFDGTVRVLDCAKSPDMVTPGYYMPEGKKDISADIRALGKILAEMTKDKSVQRISGNAVSGKYNTPSDFISDVISIMIRFPIALERDVSSLVTGKHIPRSSKKSVHMKVTSILIPVFFFISFTIGFISARIFQSSEHSTSQSVTTQFQARTISSQGDEPKETGEEKNKTTSGIEKRTETAHEREIESRQKRVKMRNSGIGTDDKISAEEKREHGYISANSVPECEIWLDGTFVDITPVVNLRVLPGRRVIEFRTRETSRRTEVEIRENEKVFIFADLKNDRLEIKKRY